MDTQTNTITINVPEVMTEDQASAVIFQALQVIAKARSAVPRSERCTLFPLKDPSSYMFFKKQEGAIWNSNEMEFSRDVEDFRSLPEPQKNMLRHVLAFFAAGDGLISENLAFRFLLECRDYEETCMFTTQHYIELVHADTYGLINYAFFGADGSKELNSMVEDIPAVRRKAEWMEKYMFSDLPKPERFIAFACAEGIFFSVSFAIIFWFRSRGILQNLIFANEQISKDEGLHRDYGVNRYRHYARLASYLDWLVAHGYTARDRAVQIVREAVEVEIAFIGALLPEPVAELTADSLAIYAKVVADGLLVDLGFDRIYPDLKNPFPWMSDIVNSQKSNFFENRVGAYRAFDMSKALDIEWRAGNRTSSTDESTEGKRVRSETGGSANILAVDF